MSDNKLKVISYALNDLHLKLTTGLKELVAAKVINAQQEVAIKDLINKYNAIPEYTVKQLSDASDVASISYGFYKGENRIGDIINIPQFLKDIIYDAESNTLSFIFQTSDGEAKIINTDITDLVDTFYFKVTYNELISLRDESKLIPGAKYRITDYITTTTQENTKSAGHQFDVIVLATSTSELNENAKAIYHEGDTYFSENGANLDAWELKYSLDNDVNRFAWADEENGKGVIYYMKDEWNNECPYDFKNIQFLRGLYVDGEGLAPEGEEDFTTYCYTFGWEKKDGTMLDATIFGNNRHILNDKGEIFGVYGNVIREYFTYTGEIENPISTKLHLNNIVFLNTYNYKRLWYDGCYSNSFGHNCYSNSFGHNCYSNSFGDDCLENSFGTSCNRNSFGNHCRGNSIGNYCSYNSFGNDFYANIFGDNCSSNSFGNYCSNNSFGNYCYANSFGNDCYYNKIEIPYTYYCHFDDGCEYVELSNEETASHNNLVQNYNFIRGLKGTEELPLTIEVERNRDYESKVAKNSLGEIKVYCEADLIA